MYARAHEENATASGYFFREDGHCFAAGRGRGGRGACADAICRAHEECAACDRMLLIPPAWVKRLDARSDCATRCGRAHLSCVLHS